MTLTGEPTGDQKVCPRCGTATAPTPGFCASCGLNLRLVDDLPTADAFSAKKREEAWLAGQAERDATSSKPPAVAPPTEPAPATHDQPANVKPTEEPPPVDTPRVEDRDRPSVPRKKPRWPWLAGLTILLLAVGSAAAAVLLKEDEKPAAPRSADAKAPAAAEPAQDEPAPAPTCDTATAKTELQDRSLLPASQFGGIGRLLCEDVTGDGVDDMAFTRQSLGSAGSIGWGLFVAKDAKWDLGHFNENDAQVGLNVADSTVASAVPIHKPGDANCCPTGGTNIREYKWAGGKLKPSGHRVDPANGFNSDFYEAPEP